MPHGHTINPPIAILPLPNILRHDMRNCKSKSKQNLKPQLPLTSNTNNRPLSNPNLPILFSVHNRFILNINKRL